MSTKLLGPNDPALDAIAEFVSSQPGFDLELTIIHWAEYHGVLMQTLEAQLGEYQAAFVPGHVWIPELADQGYISDLNPLIKQLPGLIWKRYRPDQILPRVAEESYYEGGRYTIPTFNDGHILFYRRDLLQMDVDEDPIMLSPLTLGELAVQAHNPPEVFGLALKAHPSEILFDWLPYFYAAGGELVDDALQPAFASLAGIQALGYYTNLRQYCPQATDKFGNEEIAEIMKQGKAALVATWGGQAAPIFLDKRNPFRDLYGAAVYPDPCGATWGIALPANQPEEVQLKTLETILGLNSPEQDHAVMLKAGSPVRENTYSDQNLSRFSWLRAQYVMLQRLRHLPKSPKIGSYLGPLTNALVSTFSGKAEPEEALKLAEHEIRHALSA